jgi:four helix bundle protein
MTTAELKARTKEFALRVIRLVDALPNTVKGRARSIAANYRAPCRARSRAEFIAKIGVVEEEADETAFWLELIIDSNIRGKTQIEPLLKEASELVASRKSAIGNRKSAIR